jgi:rhodanese-related sulfurtransferase
VRTDNPRINELPKDKKIITFYKSRLRAYEAQTILKGASLEDVQFMDGGLQAWPYELSQD